MEKSTSIWMQIYFILFTCMGVLFAPMSVKLESVWCQPMVEMGMESLESWLQSDVSSHGGESWVSALWNQFFNHCFHPLSVDLKQMIYF